MAVKRVVSVGFWTDSKVIDFSPEDRYFMLYLLTNPHTTLLGVYELNPKVCAFELGYSVEAVKVLLDRFENKYGLIKRSGNEIAIKNFLRYSVNKGGKPIEDCLRREIENVKDKSLVQFVKMAVIEDKRINASVKTVLDEFVYAELVEVTQVLPAEVPNPLEMPVTEFEPKEAKPSKEQEAEKKPKAEKKVYADDVHLTLVEYNNLIDRLGSKQAADECIEILSNYKGANGKKYKSDYKAILNWVIDKWRERHRAEQRGQPQLKNDPVRAAAMVKAMLAEQERRRQNADGYGC